MDVLASSSAGFKTCCVGDFQIGEAEDVAKLAGFETLDPAALEFRATPTRSRNS